MGEVIARVFDAIDYAAVPGVFVASHGRFTPGEDSVTAAPTAVVLEMLARTAYLRIGIDQGRRRSRGPCTTGTT